MQDEKVRVLLRCFGYIAVGALIGFGLPIAVFFLVYHNASGGSVIRMALISFCMPLGSLIGLSRALKLWRSFAVVRPSMTQNA